jgi:F-type H+-transporting ATPase subunit a
MSEVTPQVMFLLWGIPVRDTVVSTWVMIALAIGSTILVGKRQPMALEMLLDFVTDLVSDVMQRPARPYLPFLSGLAIFIATANVIGMVPFIVSPTRDINTPLALALTVFLSVHYFGIRANGIGSYLRNMASPIYTLPLEIVGQISRTVSLTLRLFGNILSTEMVVAVIFALVPLFIPLALIGFSFLTGLLQAYIFTALAAVYIAAGLGEVTGPVRPKS